MRARPANDVTPPISTGAPAPRAPMVPTPLLCTIWVVQTGKYCTLCLPYSRKIWRALYLANWLFRSIGDIKFGDSLSARDVFNRRMLRLINGCEHLLELQLTCKRNEIEALKSKKSKDVFEVESGV